MFKRPRPSRSALLSLRLALASVCTAVAIGVVGAVAVSSLGNVSAVARVDVGRQLSLIDDAVGMRAFTYQKGFVSQYILTGDRKWLAEPEAMEPRFDAWLAHANAAAEGPAARRLLSQIGEEYEAFNRGSTEAVALYDARHLDAAKTRLSERTLHLQRVRRLFDELGTSARAAAERRLIDEEAALRRLALMLVLTSAGGAVASLLLGFLWARRITKPIYELQVQVESAAERTRIQLAPGREGLEALGDQVGALVERLEATDAALAEHRRHLIQSEKLSAVGELAAKLAHEVLNPLAGMKAAVQLLARQGRAAQGGAGILDTAEALNREITRVEGLVRRLVNYSRPLAPRFEQVAMGDLLDSAEDAARPALARWGAAVERQAGAELPVVEVDPLLMTQALANLVTNAAEATAGTARRGLIEVEVERAAVLGRDHVVIRVADHGEGLSDERMRELFKPFFTTKPEGHGLGLAVTQNILLEHGGRILARNRPSEEGPGAVFELQFPVVR
jgi:signal transduction histidine kinase